MENLYELEAQIYENMSKSKRIVRNYFLGTFYADKSSKKYIIFSPKAAKIDAIKQEPQNSFPDYEVSSGNINFAKNKDCFVHVKQVFASTED